MSRIGKNPVAILSGVKIKLDGGTVLVEGLKGELQLNIPYGVTVETTDKEVLVKRINDAKKNKSLHGTIRNLIANMIKGVTEGYTKDLEIIGVGYRAQVKGNELNLQLGFSHPVNVQIPEGIKIATPKPTQINIQGIDKAKVSMLAAEIRMICPPEPYKGKGIRYVGEYVRKKQGKSVTK